MVIIKMPFLGVRSVIRSLSGLVVFSVVSVYLCEAQNRNYTAVHIVKNEYNRTDELGGYRFAYETSDGTFREEIGNVKNVGNETRAVIVVAGKYGYVDTNGKAVEVHYRADEFGYRVMKDRFHQLLSQNKTTFANPVRAPVRPTAATAPTGATAIRPIVITSTPRSTTTTTEKVLQLSPTVQTNADEPMNATAIRGEVETESKIDARMADR